MNPFARTGDCELYLGNAPEVLRGFADGSFQCCVTALQSSVQYGIVWA